MTQSELIKKADENSLEVLKSKFFELIRANQFSSLTEAEQNDLDEFAAIFASDEAVREYVTKLKSRETKF